MKICFVCPLPPPYGGISNWYLQLSRYIDQNYSQEIQYEVLSPPIASRSDAQGRTLFERVYYGGLGAIKTFFRFRKTIKKNRPDVVHITTSAQLALIRDFILLKVAKKYKIPAVYHIRMGRSPEIARANTLEWRIFKKIASQANSIWVLDGATQQTFENALPQLDVRRIPNPFDVGAVERSIEKNKERVALFVGWIVKTKGVEELLEAWGAVLGQSPDYVLKLIGPCDQDYRRSLQDRFPMKNVVIQGQLGHDEVLKEIAKASFLVLPSYTEGFPNVVLEAMALQTPVLATKVGAVSDMLSSDCGILVNPQDSKSLSKEMKRLASDSVLRNRISKNALLKVQNEFDIKIIIQRYLKLWQDVVNQNEGSIKCGNQ